MSPTFVCSVEVHLTMCLSVRLTRWNIMGMRGERNTWLSCTVLLHMLDIMPLVHSTINMDRIGRRAREGSEQCAYCQLERDKERARQRRQWQGPGARASERLRVRARRAREGSEQHEA